MHQTCELCSYNKCRHTQATDTHDGDDCGTTMPYAKSDIKIILLATFSCWCCQWFCSNANMTKLSESTIRDDALHCRTVDALCEHVEEHCVNDDDNGENGDKRTKACAQQRFANSFSNLFRKQISLLLVPSSQLRRLRRLRWRRRRLSIQCDARVALSREASWST